MNLSCTDCLSIASAASSAVTWASDLPLAIASSLFLNVLANSSAVIPTDSANAFCCNTFILVNSAAVPTFLANSSANDIWSPAKAAALALSKFNCLPVSNSAFNSLSIDDSKFKSDSPDLATCSKVIPNASAVTIALAIVSGLLPKLAASCPDTITALARVALKSIPTFNWFLVAVIPFKKDLYVSSDVLLFKTPKRCTWAAWSAVNPTCLVNLICVLSWSAVNS